MTGDLTIEKRGNVSEIKIQLLFICSDESHKRCQTGLIMLEMYYRLLVSVNG